MISAFKQYKATKLKRKASGRWSEKEHAIFLKGLEYRPKISWKEISKMVQTRTPRQTRTHAQKYFEKLKRKDRGVKLVSQMSSSSTASDVTSFSEFDIQTEILFDTTLVPVSLLESRLPEYSKLDADCIEALQLFLPDNKENVAKQNEAVIDFDVLN